MQVDDFTFELPQELIAAHPTRERDESRLLVVPAHPEQPLVHRIFRELTAELRAGDLLVMNNSRVIPARLLGERSGGGKAEVLLLTCLEPGQTPRWTALVRPGAKLREGAVVRVGDGELTATVVCILEAGERVVELASASARSVEQLIHQHGRMPLPPYIVGRRREAGEPEMDPEDLERYQTIYAAAEGSVAAPTAGLHFTPRLFEELDHLGVERAFVTLHVGAGTFVGMAEGGRVEDHRMHTERFEVPDSTAAAILRARQQGRRVIAVGTTTLRTLESAWDVEAGAPRTGWNETSLMITPGRKVHSIDALITNFHLPRSTLLLLVSALISRERLLTVYDEAIARRYRFFSYGDAMLLPNLSSQVV
jgi:S-adenosylmethionine:tRNA ribosyltransferase-isomerase